MQNKKMNIPGFVVKKNSNGKNVKINGRIIAINESARTADMKILGKTYKNIPMSNVRINEAFVDDVKAFAKKGWDKVKEVGRNLKTVIDKVKGKLVTLFNGEVRSNNPVLIAQQYNGGKDKIAVFLNPADKAYAKSQGITIKEPDIEELVDTLPDDAKAQNEFLKNVVEGFKNSEPSLAESFGSDKAKYSRFLKAWGRAVQINEYNYRLNTGHWDTCPTTKWSKRPALNEAESVNEAAKDWNTDKVSTAKRDSADSWSSKEFSNSGRMYLDSGVPNITAEEAVQQILFRLRTAVQGGWDTYITSDDNEDQRQEKWMKVDPKVRPMMLWGAPGIGKTVIIRNIISDIQNAIDQVQAITGHKVNESEEYGSDGDLESLQQELQALQKKRGRKSAADAARIQELQKSIQALQGGNDMPSEDNFNDSNDSFNTDSEDDWDAPINNDIIGSGKDDNLSKYTNKINFSDEENEIYNLSQEYTSTNKSGKEVFLNPVAIYTSCAGLTKEGFSLPSFSNGVNFDFDKGSSEEKYNMLVNRFGEADAKKVMNHTDKLASTKKVIEVPKSWLPLYMPVGVPEIDEILDKETYSIVAEAEGYGGRERGANCGIIFIDEFSRTSTEVMNVLMTLIDQREFEGGWRLGSRWIFVCAANRQSDMNKDTAGQFHWEEAYGTRFSQFNVLPNKAGWIKWARSISRKTKKHNIEPQWIVDFIEQSPQEVWLQISTFNPLTGKQENKSGSKNGIRLTGVNSRSWENAANVINDMVKEKEKWIDPENWTDIDPAGNVVTLDDATKRRYIWMRQNHKKPKTWNNPDDIFDITDIRRAIESNLGTGYSDQIFIADMLEEWLGYKKFWTNDRLDSICRYGKIKDPEGAREDEGTGAKLASWKNNPVNREDVFNMILRHATETYKDVVDAAVNELGTASILGAYDSNRRPICAEWIHDMNKKIQAKGITKENHPELSNAPKRLIYWLVKLDNTNLKRLNIIWNNMIEYLLKVSKQIGNGQYDMSMLALFIGSEENKNAETGKGQAYSDGLFYRTFQKIFMEPLSRWAQGDGFENAIAKVKEFNPDVDFDQETKEQIRTSYVGGYANMYLMQYIWAPVRALNDKTTEDVKANLM